jgi:hypothetical protein
LPNNNLGQKDRNYVNDSASLTVNWTGLILPFYRARYMSTGNKNEKISYMADRSFFSIRPCSGEAKARKPVAINAKSARVESKGAKNSTAKSG